MYRSLFFILVFFLSANALVAQDVDTSAIKIFVSQDHISKANTNLYGKLDDPSEIWRRLYNKTIQLVNQTGVAEIGYSTFMLTPRFDILDVLLDEAGITKIYLAQCELSFFVTRQGLNNANSAAYNSFSKKIAGSGSTRDAAIKNAITSIAVNDPHILKFISDTKSKIDAYFQANCQQVVKEADRATELQEYSRAIALYFSIPSSAKKCYDEAFKKSMGIYKKYLENECDTQLMRLKTVIALGQTNDTAISNKHYMDALRIMSNINPAADKCYSEAKQLIDKIEKRMTEQQKHKWAIEQKKATSTLESEKEAFKAMQKISSTYQPAQAPAVPPVIINNNK